MLFSQQINQPAVQCGDCGASSECASYCVVKKLREAGRQFIECVDIVDLSSAPATNPVILQHF